MLWLKLITAIAVDITTNYTVLIIRYQKVITDFPNTENAHKNGTF